MFEDIGKDAVIGTKQVLKAMQAGTLKSVYLAEDVDAFLANKIKTAAKAFSVEVKNAPSMQELGGYCGIDVGAACVGIRE